MTKFKQRICDPYLYQKRWSDFCRRYRSFDDSPRQLELDHREGKEVAVVIAHPDDESFCSGLIVELADRNCRIHVLCVTRGEGGIRGACARSDLGEVRVREMEKACQVLGVGRVEFLNHVDPVAHEFRVFAPQVTVNQLAAQLYPRLKAADLVISHGGNGEYGHPAHILVNRAVRRALGEGESGPEWLTFMARDKAAKLPELVNWDDEAHYFVDVSAREDIRESALSCHRTQLEVFAGFCRGNLRDFIDQTPIETYQLCREFG